MAGFFGLLGIVGETVALGPVQATPTDFVRLIALPVYAWAAYRDVKTRRVPNRTWLPLTGLGIVLLTGDAWMAASSPIYGLDRFVLQAGLSIGVVVPLAYVFWRIGGFGGADAKALMVLALLFPTFPAYLFSQPIAQYVGSVPVEPSPVGIFSFSALTNGVLVGITYPLGITVRNALSGRISPVMFVGRPVPVEAIPETYGRLLETPDGTTRRGLDIDALRMYLRWRGTTLAEIRADPDTFRDPVSIPDDPNPPGDGAIADGGKPVDGDDPGGEQDSDSETDPDSDSDADSELTRTDANGPDQPKSTGRAHEQPAPNEITERVKSGATPKDAPSAPGEGSVDATGMSEPAGPDGEPTRDGSLVDHDMFSTDTDEGSALTDDVVDEGVNEAKADRTGPAGPRGDDVGQTQSSDAVGAGLSETDPESSGDSPVDQWGAEAFLTDVGSAYGTGPTDLRAGLEVLVENDDVWVSPGLPFLVPLFLGLFLTFLYGDLLFGLIQLLGLV